MLGLCWTHAVPLLGVCWTHAGLIHQHAKPQCWTYAGLMQDILYHHRANTKHALIRPSPFVRFPDLRQACNSSEATTEPNVHRVGHLGPADWGDRIEAIVDLCWSQAGPAAAAAAAAVAAAAKTCCCCCSCRVFFSESERRPVLWQKNGASRGTEADVANRERNRIAAATGRQLHIRFTGS